MKIIEIIYSLSSGGAERFVVDLSNEFVGQRNNLRDFFFGPPCFSAKIELHFTLNYAAHVNQDVNRKVYTLAVSVGIPCKKYRCP